MQQATGSSEDKVRMAQKVRFGAMISGNKSTLNSVLADELSYTHATGKVETKEQFITAITSQAVTYEAIEPEEVNVRVSGRTAGATGQARFTVKTGNDRQSYRVSFTEVYTYRGGHYQLVTWQSTRLPEP